MQATYTDTHGIAHAHISITALTQNDITLMESIETTLCRYLRTINCHPSHEDEIADTTADALNILDEYGPDAVANAATPTNASELAAATWKHLRDLATRQIALHRVRTNPLRTKATPNRKAAAQMVNTAHAAFAAGHHDVAITWLRAAQNTHPTGHNYGRLHDIVEAGKAATPAPGGYTLAA